MNDCTLLLEPQLRSPTVIGLAQLAGKHFILVQVEAQTGQASVVTSLAASVTLHLLFLVMLSTGGGFIPRPQFGVVHDQRSTFAWQKYLLT
jgi:hypothetical protein